MNDLTGFQRDILRAIAALTDDDTGPKGLKIKEWLEDEAGYGKVNHGRLYPNLDTLKNKGLMTKSERDKRTNEYRLSRRGRREIQEHLNEWLDAVDHDGEVTLFPVKEVAADGGKDA